MKKKGLIWFLCLLLVAGPINTVAGASDYQNDESTLTAFSSAETTEEFTVEDTFTDLQHTSDELTLAGPGLDEPGPVEPVLAEPVLAEPALAEPDLSANTDADMTFTSSSASIPEIKHIDWKYDSDDYINHLEYISFYDITADITFQNGKTCSVKPFNDNPYNLTLSVDDSTVQYIEYGNYVPGTYEIYYTIEPIDYYFTRTVHIRNPEDYPYKEINDSLQGNFSADRQKELFLFRPQKSGIYQLHLDTPIRDKLSVNLREKISNQEYRWTYNGFDDTYPEIKGGTDYYLLISKDAECSDVTASYTLSIRQTPTPTKLEILSVQESYKAGDKAYAGIFDTSLRVRITYDDGSSIEVPRNTDNPLWRYTDGYGNAVMSMGRQYTFDFTVEPIIYKAGTYPITVRLGYWNDEEYYYTTSLTAQYTVNVTGKNPVNLSKAVVAMKNTVIYNSKAQKPVTAVKLNGKTLKAGKDYTVTYKNNKAIGTASVSIKGKGSYTGTLSKTFKIIPKTIAVKTVKALGSGRIKTTWTKDNTATGYEFYYSYDSKKSFKKTLIKKNTTTAYTQSKLRPNKYCYVKMRSYTVKNGKTYYSKYSKVFKVKVK